MNDDGIKLLSFNDAESAERDPSHLAKFKETFPCMLVTVWPLFQHSHLACKRIER